MALGEPERRCEEQQRCAPPWTEQELGQRGQQEQDGKSGIGATK